MFFIFRMDLNVSVRVFTVGKIAIFPIHALVLFVRMMATAKKLLEKLFVFVEVVGLVQPAVFTINQNVRIKRKTNIFSFLSYKLNYKFSKLWIV